MNGHSTAVEFFPHEASRRILFWTGALILLMLLSAKTVRAASPQIPWECSNYEGDAQTRCLNGFIELQRDKIERLEGQLEAQQSAVGRLKDQIDQQASATAHMQRKLSERPAPAIVQVPYPYAYSYPPGLGLALYLSRPWIYGAPYYDRPYWNFRYHRRGGHRH